MFDNDPDRKRLTYMQSKAYPDEPCWRFVVYDSRRGKCVLFEDVVLERNAPQYMRLASRYDVGKIVAVRLGTVRNVMENDLWKPRYGSSSLSKLRQLTPLDDPRFAEAVR